MTNMFIVMGCALTGALAGSLLACLPGLHILNVMGVLALLVTHLSDAGSGPPLDVITAASLGLMVGYAIFNTLPSVLLGAPDESALFTVLPGQAYLLRGEGAKAVSLTALGAAAGLAFIALAALPGVPRLLVHLQLVLRGHTHWILWTIIAFMLLSEWPRPVPPGYARWRAFRYAWAGLGAGLLTFLLAGLLGFILLYRSPVSHTSAFQNLMPAFVGLFTIPWLLLNIVAAVRPPIQSTEMDPGASLPEFVHGASAGLIGGSLAAFLPVVTGGVGGWLAGHATAMRSERAFLISQGASKVVYYVGGLVLLFVPRLHLHRGGAAWLLSAQIEPVGAYGFYVALGAVGIAGACCLALVKPLTLTALAVLGRADYRIISLLSLLLATTLVVGMTGVAGLAVMVVATGIGLLPVLFGSRRMNALAIIMLPLACQMSGIGERTAQLLGLL
jgi:putative membrane protein